MTDYKTEYAAFRADVLSRILPYNGKRWNKYKSYKKFRMYHCTSNMTVKQLIANWSRQDEARDAAFHRKCEIDFPNLFKAN